MTVYGQASIQITSETGFPKSKRDWRRLRVELGEAMCEAADAVLEKHNIDNYEVHTCYIPDPLEVDDGNSTEGSA